MNKSARIVTAVFGVLMFLPGLNKFFEPAKTKFFTQLTLSELPFPTSSYWLAIWSEVTIGLTLVLLALLENKFTPVLRQNLFYFCHLVVSVMMLVAIYVHLHPAVPAEVLPLAKPPYMPTAYLLIVSMSIYLNRRSSRTIQPHLNHGD